ARGAAGYAEGGRLFTAKIEVEESLRALRAACWTEPAARQREACCALVQVYAAYHPSPQLDWLGCSPGSVAAEAARIRSVIRPPGEIPAVAPLPKGPRTLVAHSPARLCRPDVIHGIAGTAWRSTCRPTSTR